MTESAVGSRGVIIDCSGIMRNELSDDNDDGGKASDKLCKNAGVQ